MNQGSPVKILLVDDDDVDAMLIERAFRKAEITNELIIARDAIEAIQIMRGTSTKSPLHRPYLVLIDLNMPRMSGLEFLDEIRADPLLRNSMVFVLTTSNHTRDLTEAYNRFATGYIVKPNAGDGFLEMIRMFSAFWNVVSPPPPI